MVAATTVALAARGMLIAEAIGGLMREQGLHVVGCYMTPAALLEKARRCRPAVVIVDTDLVELPGALRALLTELREASPTSKRVVLTGDVDAPFARAVMAATRPP